MNHLLTHVIKKKKKKKKLIILLKNTPAHTLSTSAARAEILFIDASKLST